MTMQGWISKLRRPQEEPSPDAREKVIGDLREVRRQLDGLQSYFALESDEDLLDAAIYQREALEARHRYLLKLAREQKLYAHELPVVGEELERWIN